MGDSCAKHRNRLASLGMHIANQVPHARAVLASTSLEPLEEHFERLRCLRQGHTSDESAAFGLEFGYEASPHALRAEQRLQVPAQAASPATVRTFTTMTDDLRTEYGATDLHRAFSTEGSEGLVPWRHSSLQSQFFSGPTIPADCLHACMASLSLVKDAVGT